MAVQLGGVSVEDQKPFSECCTPIAPDALTSEQAREMARPFKALSDPARLQLVSLIASNGEMCVCDLTEPLALSQPTVSHHLKVLTDAGLVTREKRGRWAYFSIADDALNELGAAIRT